jgi:uncharacterized membrane protein
MKKEILIGFLVGLIANSIGVIICLLIISNAKDLTFESTLNFYLNTGNLWMIISLGALPNLLAFFGFLKQNREYRARGVVMATFVAAITTYLIYFI